MIETTRYSVRLMIVPLKLTITNNNYNTSPPILSHDKVKIGLMIIKQELLFFYEAKGYFRGMASPLLTYGVVNAIFFGVYGNCLKVLQRVKKHNRITYMDVFVSGCVAGAAQVFVACPADLFKVVLQSQIPHEVSTSSNTG